MPAQVNDLVGTWRLVAASYLGRHGDIDEKPFGTAPAGLLIYSADGTMAAMISYGGRRPLSADRVAAPADERAAAFATFFAYGGYYSVDGDRVIHRVRVASVQNWVGTELIRELSLSDDRLRLRTPELLVGGVSRVTELFWERVRDANRGLG